MKEAEIDKEYTKVYIYSTNPTLYLPGLALVKSMDVSIIIVNHNGGDVLRGCLRDLGRSSEEVSAEVIVVDNASTDGSVENVEEEVPGVKLVRESGNLGFGHGCNAGALRSRGSFLLFLNPDARLEQGVLAPMVAFMRRHPDVGVIGPQHRYSDGAFQPTAGVLPNVGVEAIDKLLYALHRRRWTPVQRWLEQRFSQVRDVEWVSGSCLMIRRELFEELGGFDERFFLYFEDKDLCRRVRDRDFRVVYLPHVRVTHLLGRSSGDVRPELLRSIYRQSQRRYYQKHHGHVQNFLLNLYQGFSS